MHTCIFSKLHPQRFIHIYFTLPALWVTQKPFNDNQDHLSHQSPAVVGHPRGTNFQQLGTSVTLDDLTLALVPSLSKNSHPTYLILSHG